MEKRRTRGGGGYDDKNKGRKMRRYELGVVLRCVSVEIAMSSSSLRMLGISNNLQMMHATLLKIGAKGMGK